MTQRNPMNERYKGDGPSGRSKKSASSAKPARPAASTVWEKSKTLTPAEKRKAEKAAQRAAEEKKKVEAEKAKAEGKEAPKAAPKSKEYKLDPEYRKWRKWYWGLLIAAIVATSTSFVLIYTFQVDSALSYIPLGIAYATIIPALIIDYRKVRPFREGLKQTGDKTPKQLKHAEEAAAQAKAIEEARKASRRVKIGKRTTVKKDTEDQAVADRVDETKNSSQADTADATSVTSSESQEKGEK